MHFKKWIVPYLGLILMVIVPFVLLFCWGYAPSGVRVLAGFFAVFATSCKIHYDLFLKRDILYTEFFIDITFMFLVAVWTVLIFQYYGGNLIFPFAAVVVPSAKASLNAVSIEDANAGLLKIAILFLLLFIIQGIIDWATKNSRVKGNDLGFSLLVIVSGVIGAAAWSLYIALIVGEI